MNRILPVALWLCFAAAAALIIISAQINYKYGTQISALIGCAFLAFGFVEIFLPVISKFAVGFAKKLGTTMAAVLALLSVVTAASFLSAHRYEAEDKAKGYSAQLSSSNEVAGIAMQSYRQASEAAAKAQQKCDAEKAKGGGGYFTKFCNMAKDAEAAKSAAFSQLQSASQGVEKSRGSVIAPGDKIFHDIARWTGTGDHQSWKNTINTFTALMLAITGWACIMVILNVSENRGLFSSSIGQGSPGEKDISNYQPPPQPAPKVESDNKPESIEAPAAAPQEQAKALKSELQITGKGTCRIPLEQSQQGYIASINVNGKKTRFIVDTGATNLSISKGTYSAIGKPRGEPAELVTSSGSVRTFYCKVGGQMGTFKFDHAEAVVCDHNLLGMELLRPLNAQIDYERSELVLSRGVKESKPDDSPKQQPAKRPAKSRSRKRKPADNESIARRLISKGVISPTVRGLISKEAKSKGLNVGTKSAKEILSKIKGEGKNA